MTDNEKPQTAIEKIERHLVSKDVFARFTPILDKAALPFINSVMILVRESTSLQRCTPESIESAAYRSANLGLSVDPIARQAHLVAYRINKGTKQQPIYVYEASFQAHYMGIYNLAMRTRRYVKIEVIAIPKGYDVLKRADDMELVIVKMEGDDPKPVVFMPKVDDIDAIGFLGYMRSKDGVVTKVYRTVDEIRAHAQKYSKSWKSPDSLWHHKDHKATMAKKTVLLELLKFADLTGTDDGIAKLRDAFASAKDQGDVIDVVATDVEQPIDDTAESGDDPVDPTAKTGDTVQPKRDPDAIIRDLTGTTRVQQLKEMSEKDITSAFWYAVKDAGLTHDEGQAILKEKVNFKDAFEAIIKKYKEVING